MSNQHGIGQAFRARRSQATKLLLKKEETLFDLHDGEMFLQRINGPSGKREWHYVDDAEDLKNEIARSTYAGMLHDTERNMKYNQAISKAMDMFRSKEKKSRVLDIGTGTGILAMMAANSNAFSVTACEVFKPMAEKARDIIKANNLSEKIKVIEKQSTEMSVGTGLDMEEKADILVTEIFDTELIGEGVLPTLRDANKRLMNAESVTIPSSGTVHLVLAECPSLWKAHKLGDLKLKDGRTVNQGQNVKNCRGTASAYEVHIDSVDDIKMLTEPIDAISIDFSKSIDLKQQKDGIYNSYSSTAEVKIPGNVHCIVLWWSIMLDEDGEISLSMVPKCCSKNANVKWRDHWMQAVYFVPEKIAVKTGESVNIAAFHDDYSFWFDIRKFSSSCTDDFSRRPACSCGLHTSWSRERFSMNNDSSLRETFNSALEKVSNGKSCLVVGDVSLLPVIASSYFQKIYYIECTDGSKNVIQKLVSLNHLSEKIKIIKITELKDESLLQLPNIDEIDVLLAEPYFSSSLLPWQHFSFWYHISPLLTMNAPMPIILPSKAVLKIAAVQFKDLWKARCPVKEVEGFTMEEFDAVIKHASAPNDKDDYGLLFEMEPYPVWEYENEILSGITDAGTFDFSTQVPDNDIAFDGTICDLRAGKCNAMVAWIDFYLDECSSWTTGFQVCGQNWVDYSKQGVLFLEDPCHTDDTTFFRYHIVFKPKTCSLLFNLKTNG